MSGRVADKVAIVTGGASGIGERTAHLLAAEGARVVVGDLDGDGAQRVAGELRAAGAQATAVRADMASLDEIRALIETAVGTYARIDVLFNNAAIVANSSQEQVAEIRPDVWEQELRVNLTGPMLAAKFAIPHMLSGGGGSIIHNSSINALRAGDDATAYGVAKSGLLGLSRAIAVQYGRRGIRSNVIAPGLTLTPAQADLTDELRADWLAHTMGPRLGTAADQASVVLFLASDESAYVNGHVLVVDGGQTIHLPTVSGRPESPAMPAVELRVSEAG